MQVDTWKLTYLLAKKKKKPPLSKHQKNTGLVFFLFRESIRVFHCTKNSHQRQLLHSQHRASCSKESSSCWVAVVVVTLKQLSVVDGKIRLIDWLTAFPGSIFNLNGKQVCFTLSLLCGMSWDSQTPKVLCPLLNILIPYHWVKCLLLYRFLGTSCSFTAGSVSSYYQQCFIKLFLVIGEKRCWKWHHHLDCRSNLIHELSCWLQVYGSCAKSHSLYVCRIV